MVLYSLDEAAACAVKSAAVLVDRAEHDKKKLLIMMALYTWNQKHDRAEWSHKNMAYTARSILIRCWVTTCVAGMHCDEKI
jgi:hypothetical protein